MITERIRYGRTYEYDDETGLFLDTETGNKSKNPRPSQKGKLSKQVDSKRVYYIWPDVEPKIADLLTTEEEAEQYWLIQTKLFQKENLMKRDSEEQSYAHYCCDEWLYIAGAKYRVQLRNLVDRGLVDIVELDNTIWNRPVLGYRMADIYYQTTFTREFVRFHRRSKGLNKYYAMKERHMCKVDREMFRFLRHFTINLDYPTFFQEINRKYDSYLALFNLKVANLPAYKGKVPLNRADYVLEQGKMYRRIEMWNDIPPADRIEFFNVDKFGRRFHSIFSAMPSELRKYVECDGKRFTHCIDLTSSQFVFAADMLAKAGITSCKFIDDVESGKFYENYADLNEFRGPQRRNIAKLWAFNCLFGTVHGPAHKMFEDVYPVAGKEFRRIKSSRRKANEYGIHNGKIKMNANLAMDLQRAESALFRRVWNTLMGQGIKFIPVHDSVYVTEEDYQRAKTEINIILNDYFDIKFHI